MNILYKSWAKFGLPLASISVGLLLFFDVSPQTPLFWIWIQFPVYLIHEFEEHVWPGKFKEFINGQVFHSPNKNKPLDDAGVFWINILVVWILFPLGAVLAQTVDMRIGSLLPIFGLFNATTHILGFVIKRKYNPGLAVSATLNYPLGIYSLLVLSRNGELNWTTSGISLVLALIIHLMIIVFVVHRFKKMKAS